MKIIGIADTTFARYDMGRSVIEELKKANALRVSFITKKEK